MNILVIDTKLMMYKQYHSHKPAMGFLENIANLSLKLLPHIHKVVFVKDLGKSKRCEIYPNYKGKREETKDAMSSSEKARLKKFLAIYSKVDPILAHLGSVIAINGIEADDLGAIIAERLSGEHHIYLMSGDEDWSRFLVHPNTTMVHPTREKLITERMGKKEFGAAPNYKLIIDSVMGVAKESVDGITKLGKKRAVAFFEESQHDKEKYFDLLDSMLKIKKFGMVLPEWATCAEDVYERNSKIFATHKWEELDEFEQGIFLDGWQHKPSRNLPEILDNSLMTLGTPYIPTYSVTKFFRITAD